MTSATKPTCGLASKPMPVTTPAHSNGGPLCHRTARITSQHTIPVLNRSGVVVETMCPTPSANPAVAVPSAATTCPGPLARHSRATSAATTAVPELMIADGSRSSSNEPGARWCSAAHRNGTSNGWSGYPNAGC